MRRGVSLVDWKKGLVAYVEADEKALEEFKKILELCGNKIEPRNVPCLSSLASKLEVNSTIYVTDLYGIANSLAFSKKIPRVSLLAEAWTYLGELICAKGEVECDEEVGLRCCVKCDLACLLAKVLGIAGLGTKIDVREQVKKRLAGEG
ncbi:MAG: hypothetical protein ABWK05_07420 [Pyrobaculum sp.]